MSRVIISFDKCPLCVPRFLYLHAKGFNTLVKIRPQKNLRRINDAYRQSKTELFDERHIMDKATQMHHIFPVNEFPAIAVYPCPLFLP